MEKLLITRTDSLVGAGAAVCLADRMEVVGTADAHPTNVENLIQLIDAERPQLVLHAGPISASAWDVGGVGTARIAGRPELRAELAQIDTLADACRRAASKLIVVATDGVFDGPRMFHGEQAPACSKSIFGRAAAEIEGRWAAAGALVVRTHVYGWSPSSYGENYAERMFRELTGEVPCPVDAVRHSTPILSTDLAEMLYDAYRADLRGVFHIAGAERTSPYRFAAELASALGVPGRFVNLISRAAAARRPYIDETSLNTLAARRVLERPMPMLREGLARFAAQAFNGFRERVAGDEPARIEAPIRLHQAA